MSFLSVRELIINQISTFPCRLQIFFILQAYDGGYPDPRTDTINVTVSILHTPRIALMKGYQIVVPENEPANFSVITLLNYTFDPDVGSGGMFQYLDIKADDNLPVPSFAINPHSGEITTLRSFDYNVQPIIVVTILMRDLGIPPLERYQNLTIFIILPPKFSYNTSASIYEYLPYVVVLREYRATNLGIGAGSEVITYSIIDGDPQGDFRIDPSNGGINVTTGLNRTRYTSYTLTILAIDHGTPPLSGTGYMSVTVLEYNKHAPIFTQNPYTVHFLENTTAGSVIYRVNTTDQDTGTNALRQYFMSNTTNTTRFIIRNTTGEIVTNSTFNREALSVFTFMVIAVDKGLVPGPLTGTTTVQVFLDDVNDNPPIFNASSFNGSMVEHSPAGTSVLLVQATDKDPTSPNNKLRYSLARDLSDLFVVDPVSGVVYVNGSVDWTDGPVIELTAIATDLGTPPMSSNSTVFIAIITINYYAPVFRLLTLSVLEGQPLDTMVGCVLATDRDNPGNNSEVWYSLSHASTGWTFVMDISGCVITNATLDREVTPQYNTTVQATDHGTPPMSTTGTLTIIVVDVNDNSPIFASSFYSATVTEIIPIGTSILQVHASDQDIGTNALVRYSIVEDFARATFAVNESTGVLYAAGLYLYEQQHFYQFHVVAMDSGVPPLNDTTLVQISSTDYNVHPPVFGQSSYSAQLRENLAPGHVIFRVNSTDADSDNNAITGYSLAPTPGSTYFAIDSDTGVLYTTNFIDREVTPFFNLTIVANNTQSDHPLSSTVSAFILITDLNDNNPTFPLTVNITVSEGTMPGTVISRLLATDGDEGLNGTVLYFIYNGNDEHTFELDPDSGNLTLKTYLNVQAKPLYMFSVMASDLGTPSLSNYTNVLVTVIGSNSHAPVFTSDTYLVTIYPMITTGQVVAFISAFDTDQNSSLTYTLSGGGGQFKLASNTSGIVVSVASATLSSAYNLTVQVSDTLHISTTQLQIQLYKVDFIQFKAFNFNASIAQNALIGTSIFNLAPNVMPSGSYTYSIESGNVGGVFRLTGSSVELAGQLNYENQSLYELTIGVQNSFGNKSYALLHIQVNDTNKYPPLFLLNTTFIAIPETTTTNLPIFSMITTDRDGLAANRYAACLFQPSSPVVSFLPSSCRLQLNSPGLNYLTGPHTYNLTVNASNIVNPALSSISQLSIKVLNGNKYSPQFTTNLASVQYYLDENSTVGTIITTATATDLDIGSSGEITYGMFGDQHHYLDFTIDTYTGVIWQSNTLDFARQSFYILAVVAGDGGNPGRTATSLVNIQIVDTNNNAPMWQRDSYSAAILENTTINSQLITVAATDGDHVDMSISLPALRLQYGYVSYSITAGDPLNQFRINIDTGVVTIVAPLDREQVPAYNLTLTATDGGGLYNNAYLYIQLLDVNDNAPLFQNITYSATVPENAPLGTFMVQLTAMDKDIGTNAIFTFAITGGNTYNSFRINATTGNVYTNASLDRENISVYNLVVTATDKGIPTLRSSVNLTARILDINDNAPTFTQTSYNASVYENRTLGFVIKQIVATDPDYGENSTVMYSIVTQNSTLPLPFAINISTGALVVNGHLNYKTSVNYTFVILAQDSGNLQIRLSSYVNITIYIIAQNLNPPLFLNASYTGYVLLNAGPGAMILTVSAYDNDALVNAQFSFSLDFRGNILSSANFVIDPLTGRVGTSNTTALSRANPLVYNIIAVATDMGIPPLSSTANLTIVVIDAPQFKQLTYSGQIYENEPSYTSVISVTAIGINPVGYSVSSLVTSQGDCRILCSNASFCSSLGFTLVPPSIPLPFAVNWSTNVIVSNASFDRENISEYVVTVKAYDIASNGSLYNTTCIYVSILDVNDNSPKFAKQTYWANISENANNGTPVATVTATDVDIGVNAIIQYSIITGGEYFIINSTSGLILTRASGFRYERQNIYNLTVMARDGGTPPLNSTVTVTVALWDENNYPPVFSQTNYSSSLLENLPAGSTVITVSAGDIDSGINALVTFLINSSNPAWDFVINSTTGVITTAKPLDRESIPSYNLTLVAMDHGVPPLYGTSTVMVKVLDANDNQPVFVGSPYVVNVTENALPSLPIFNLKATDADIGTNALIFFSLISVVPRSDAFEVNQTTGAISLTAPLDAEASLLYVVLIMAGNGPALPNQTTLVNVSVNVLDVNDNNPYFNSTSFSAAVHEHALVGTQVAQLIAKDNDSTAANSIVSYYIIGGFNISLFSINSTTGVVYLHLPLNKRDAYYLLIIQAQDNGLPSLLSNTTLFVTVLHTNDYPPYFTQDSYLFGIIENEPPHTLVGQIQAFDIDFQEVVSYALSNSSNDAMFFYINSSTGQIYSTISFDSEEQNVYLIVALAMDNGTMSRTSQVNITVDVLNVYDDPPEFLQDEYSVSWPENTPIGMVLLTITAENRDVGNDSRIEYLLSGKDSLPFAINFSRYGNISLAKNLDREQQDLYRFVAMARDAGYPILNTTSNITIQVLDVNDNVPILNASSYSASLVEDDLIGTFIMVVSATDKDIGLNARMSFSLSNSFHNLFVIGNTSGTAGNMLCVLWLNGSLDYETVKNYTFFIVATDAGSPPLSSSSQVNIFINDSMKNEVPPIFSASTYNVTVPENTLLQSSIIQLLATDGDTGINGIVRYSIVSGNSGDSFAIDAATGWVISTNFFNRDNAPTFSLTVLAADMGTPSFSAYAVLQVTIADVNNNPPAFSSRVYTTVIPEDTPIGQVIATILANDTDIGINAKINYTIVAGNTTVFRVNSQSGAVMTAAKLEYKTVMGYDLSIMAQDGGMPPLYDIANLRIVITQVDQYPPAFQQSLYNLTISKSTTYGTVLAYMVAANADVYSSTPITYSLIQLNSNVTNFAINPNTGAISVIDANFVVGVIQVTIQAKGATKFYPTNATLLVNVVTNTTIPAIPIILVPENTPPQSAIRQLGLPGPAALSSGSSLPFSVLSDGTLTLTAPLDAETKLAYCFNVKTTLASTIFYNIVTVLVQGVNDLAPQFESSSYIAHLPELAPVNTTVAYISAFDRDVAQSNSKVQLSITGGNGSEIFTLDPTSGRLILISSLNYEATSVYNLVVTATDSSLSSSVNVTVLITDANLHSPKFDSSSYFANVLASDPVGRSILTVRATDADTGTNADISYFIVQASAPAAFSINSTTGAIYSSATLLPAAYSLTVLAADRAVPPLTDKTFVTITVYPTNVNAPVFSSPEGYSVTVPESVRVGSSLAQITATDPDGSSLIYTILAGDTVHFQINPLSGLITLTSGLSYLVQSFYTLTVQAVDAGYPPKSANVAVNLTVLRVIADPPQFNQSAYSISVPEDTPVGAVLLRMFAASLPGVEVSYSISQNALSPTTQLPLFNISATTGELAVSSALDYETLRSADIVVNALGVTYPISLSNSVHVTVTVVDVNDNPPIFTRAVYQATAVRLLPAGELVLTVATTNTDWPLVYSLVGGNGVGDLFRIDPLSAEITTVRRVEENDTQAYNVTVQVSNGKYLGNASVMVQLVSSGSFCEGM